MLYHFAGWLSAFLFFVCLIGLWLQIHLIWQRKSTTSSAPTAVLSLNHFTIRFVAFYAYFVFGLTAEPFNHYLVWPRLPAIILILLILWEIYSDRQDRGSTIALVVSILMTVYALVGWGVGELVTLHYKSISHITVIGITPLILQSDLHQIYLIRRSGDTGAVSLRTHQTTFLKDLSTVFLGLTMGLGEGWPILIGSGISALTKGAIIWHFRWVANSPIAAQRRKELEL